MKSSVISGLLLGMIFAVVAGSGTVSDAGRSGANSLNNSSIAAPYAALVQKQDDDKLALPKTIILTEQGQKLAFSPGQLGITLDETSATAYQQIKNLPLRAKGSGDQHEQAVSAVGFFGRYKKPVYIRVNKSVLTDKLNELARTTKQPPVDASIVTQGQALTITPSAAGRQIDVGQAVLAINKAVLGGKDIIDLPMVGLPPAVTEVSLQPKLQQMKDQQAAALAAAKQAAAAKAATAGSCANNTATQLILVSISRQHMWACQGSTQVYDSPITSGAYLAGNATPTGTWHIYSKSTNIHLIGPTWDDFVNYWMPFYSDYGFHDSSWQTFPYGDPAYASEGSHGCVHLPLAAMAWLYGWSHIGTTVTITA